MLIIRASLRPSQIQGIGLFAEEKILKDSITWRFNPRFDILFDPEEIVKMSLLQRNLIKHFAYLSKLTGKYVYSIDDSRFTNHSSKQNNIDVILLPDELEMCGIANRNIEVGEEIISNYRTFDANDENGDEEYLNN